MRTSKDPIAQQVALKLLSLGMGTPGEIAVLSGVSRQLVEGWAKHAKLNWRRIRRERLGRVWSKELQRGYAIQRKIRGRRARLHDLAGSELAPLQDD